MPEQISSLTVFDYEDRELLHILAAVSETDEDGWASTEDLAERIRIIFPAHKRNGYSTPKEQAKARERYAKACISRRYSYMASAGWVERGDWGALRVWRLTDIGRRLMDAALTPEIERTLARLSPGDRVLLMRSLTDAYRHAAPEERTMVRRQFQHGTHDRRTRRIIR